MSILESKQRFVNSEFDKAPNVEILAIVDLQLKAYPDQRTTYYFVLKGKTYVMRCFIVKGEPVYVLDPELRHISHKRRRVIFTAILSQEAAWRESNPPMLYIDRAFVEVQA